MTLPTSTLPKYFLAYSCNPIKKHITLLNLFMIFSFTNLAMLIPAKTFLLLTLKKHCKKINKPKYTIDNYNVAQPFCDIFVYNSCHAYSCKQFSLIDIEKAL